VPVLGCDAVGEDVKVRLSPHGFAQAGAFARGAHTTSIVTLVALLKNIVNTVCVQVIRASGPSPSPTSTVLCIMSFIA
jgi:hypothetical protein